MTPIVAFLFMAGVILAIVGAGRGLAAVRAALSSDPGVDANQSNEPHDDPLGAGRWLSPAARLVLPAVGWSAVSVYGLILAVAGILLAP